jgi:hypothetical protein
VRVEPQGAGLLISLRLVPDLDKASGHQVYTFAYPRLALEAIRRFLLPFGSGAHEEGDGQQ